MKKHALLIGINYYANPSIRLNGCIEDVRRFRSYLFDNGWDDSEVTMLTDEPCMALEKIGELENSGGGKWGVFSSCISKAGGVVSAVKTSSLGILVALHKLKERTWDDELDMAIIYYSGHGGDVPGLVEMLTGQDEEALMPADSGLGGMITSSMMMNVLKDYNMNTKVVCFFDACNSGDLLRLPYVYDGDFGEWQDNMNKRKYINYSNCANITTVAGCRKDQDSVDTYLLINNEKKNGGAFTFALMEALGNMSYVDIKPSQLLLAVKQNLEKKGKKQVPVLQSTSNNDDCLF